MSYRGRLAPTPTGHLHVGHARTFHLAWQRARQQNGQVIFRNEDLDHQRCKPEFVQAMYEDLRWLGLDWDEGPDTGGPHAPYTQSQRLPIYLGSWKQLLETGCIYPSPHSRRDVLAALGAPHAEDEGNIFPTSLRPSFSSWSPPDAPGEMNWRFRVPDDEAICFVDGNQGPQSFTAGKDFGDFLVWRKDGFPSYEMAVVVDDAEMGISEVVRGEDLLLSTARQLLICRALQKVPPAYFHVPLVKDASGQRLAKRHAALSIAHLRKQGHRPEELLQMDAGV